MTARNYTLGPSTVLVEPTNVCNLACSFCEANRMVNQSAARHDLDPHSLEIILNKISGSIINIVFQGDGEPTLHDNLPLLIKIASSLTSSVAVVTNGTRLQSDYTRELITNGANWFTFSIDDHRPDVFNNFRKGADLKDILKNLDNCISLRDTIYHNLHICVHKIVMPDDSLESLKDFITEFYIDRPVNQITLSPLVHKGVTLIKNYLSFRNRLENYLFEKGIYLNLGDLNSFPYRSLNKYCGTNLLFIDREGNVSPCGLHVRQKRYFGNLVHQTLYQILNSRPYMEYFDYWEDRNYSQPLPSICTDCFVLKSNYHRYTLNEGHFQGLPFDRLKNEP
jgi:radical SAM protein with 4Fe4S-binding SPASM domain